MRASTTIRRWAFSPSPTGWAQRPPPAVDHERAQRDDANEMAEMGGEPEIDKALKRAYLKLEVQLLKSQIDCAISAPRYHRLGRRHRARRQPRRLSLRRGGGGGRQARVRRVASTRSTCRRRRSQRDGARLAPLATTTTRSRNRIWPHDRTRLVPRCRAVGT